MKYITLIFLIFFLSGCREEIIDPSSSGGNINEPLLSTSRDIYSFSVNARNITEKISNNSDLNTFYNQLYISVTDYQTGSVAIRVFSTKSEVIYQNSVSKNENGIYSRLSSDVPRTVEIQFSNFTGKLKFEISPAQ